MDTAKSIAIRSSVWLVMTCLLVLTGATLVRASCGDDVVDGGEQCDGIADAACPGLCLEPGGPNECQCPVCGDGEANQTGEQCDGNDGNCPGECLSNCTCPGCGNNVTEATEICDGSDDAACPGACLPADNINQCRCPVCGDDDVNQASEECDTGDDAACSGKCLADCTCATCGDNVTEAPAETCDGTDDAACPGLCGAPGGPTECQCPFCGDGVINQVGETCDRHDDAACPAHCATDCTCAVCGNDVAEPYIETCDGVDDGACPGLCFPPGDPHECVCPLTLNKCAAKKQKCVSAKTAGLLKCHMLAESHGTGQVDAVCVQKVKTKFDGGLSPWRGCFERLELPSHCFTEDDTAAIEAKVDAFVDAVVLQIDPQYPAPVTDKCGVAKKTCTSRFAAGLLLCRAKAEARNTVIDPVCVQKYTDRFDGGATPSSGCFEKIEAKTTCMTVDDAAIVAGLVNDFVQEVACDLDPYRAECGP